MRIPSIHMNGTSAESLLESLLEAYSAVNKAVDAVAAAAPNARDYYPQGDNAFVEAREEHRSRLERLQSVQEELMEIAVAVQDQEDAKNTRPNPARRPRLVQLFCYGSNNTDQLESRLGIPGGARGRVQGAYAPDYQRVFRGMSRNWGGGTASLKRKKGAVTYGLIAELALEDLDKLDRYEGVRSGVYKRQKIKVITQEGEELEAIAYVSLKKDFNPPTEEYLEAVAETIGMFWEGSNGPVTADDIPIS